MAASMPAVPVPEMAIVMSFSVRKRARRGRWVSSRSWRNVGGRWPGAGAIMARGALGIVQELEERRVQVADDGRHHGAVAAGVAVGGAGAEEEAGGYIQL